jgi:tetratricopeptide (TPR) repeat protein
MALERQGESQQAWDVLARVNPNDLKAPEWLVEIARLYARGDRLEQAAEVAGRLIEIPDWEVAGYVILAMVRFEQGDAAATCEALTHAIEKDPNLSGVPMNPAAARKLLARTLLQSGQPAKAREQLATIVSATDDLEAHWLLSRAFLQEDSVDAANKALDQAAEFGEQVAHFPEPAPYVGSEACLACHKNIYEVQQNSRHAQTLRFANQLSSLPIEEQSLADSHQPAVTHEWRQGEDGIHLQTRVGEQTFQSVVRFVIGSGRHGITPVTRDPNGGFFECRLSYYGQRGIWFKTDGQADQPNEPEQYVGRELNTDALRRCLHCHATSASAALTGVGPESADRGIGCERCHGPGGHHVKAVELQFSDLAIARPQQAPRDDRVRVCGQCHSPRTGSVPNTESAVVRFQASTLVQSPCFIASPDLDCVTCHNPHSNVQTSAEHYEAKCLKCHSTARSRDDSSTEHRGASSRVLTRPSVSAQRSRTRPVYCTVNPTNDCVRCHMPVVENAMSHTSFTDHHIRVHRPAR